MLLAATLVGGYADAGDSIAAPSPSGETARQSGSITVHRFADWIVETNDNQSMRFVIVDKLTAEVVVFYADGRVRGATLVSLGLAIGDDSVPGISTRKLSSIRPEERTTPAGRFVSSSLPRFARS